MTKPPWITVEGRRRRFRWLRLSLGLVLAEGRKPIFALRHLRALRDEFGDTDLYSAFEGKLLLQAGDAEAARKAYADIFEEMRHRADDTGKFIRYVAEGWLGVLNTNPLQAERCFALAKDIPVRSTLKLANPGPVFDKPDKFDRAFEKWMKRN